MNQQQSIADHIENSRFEPFGEYAAIAEKIEKFILEGMGYSAYTMKGICDGESYHEEPDKAKNGFAKLGYYNKTSLLILRFGKKSEGGHYGVLKQIEIDRTLGHQKERSLKHINRYPNEAFIYLKYIAENDNDQTWRYIKKNIKLAFEVYYHQLDEKEFWKRSK